MPGLGVNEITRCVVPKSHRLGVRRGPSEPRHPDHVLVDSQRAATGGCDAATVREELIFLWTEATHAEHQAAVVGLPCSREMAPRDFSAPSVRQVVSLAAGRAV